VKYSSGCCKFASEVNKSSWRKCLFHSAGFIRKEQMVGILRGEFVNHRKPLDLGKAQGRYGSVFPRGSKLRRGGAFD
jgi:hypothetical protein